ncbi:OprD family porin [Metapseudomonas resinovorans]|uniref:Porin OprD n=1 Tax=Metapseudomonas resinovorans NBRC 106553 TaxID=1245471 RepID=S6AVB4_METRE|nr:OprD family porin [Pseudomonas resinovorans]BAN50168.1 porin OprD [Pseudomonas resinovorans NBRC 106553]
MQVMKWSALALAVTAGSMQLAFASAQSESKGFVEDANLTLLNKNFAFYRDFRNNPNDRQNYRNEWAHGMSLNFESGYTEGTVGFGVDAHGMLGLKLNSGGGTNGTGLLPIGDDGKAQDDYSYAGGAVKMQVSSTQLKYGNLFPTAPVFATGTARLFPSSAEGFQLTSSEIEGLNLDAGHFTAIRDGNLSTRSNGEISTAYTANPDITARNADYVGGTYAITDNVSVSLYGSELEDIWRQYYGNLNLNFPITDAQAVNLDFNVYRTLDEGEAKAGSDIDGTIYSVAAAYSISAHKFTLAYQRNNADTPFDYIGMDFGNSGDSIFLANSVQYSDFNGPNEKSWQARYDLNMAEYGVPGLSFMARYISGKDVDGTKANQLGPYGGIGDDGKEWERNIEAKYVVQEGPAKDLSIRLRHATWRANSDMAFFGSAGGTASDEIRVITEYPLDIL